MTNTIPSKTCPKCLHTWQIRTANPIKCPICGFRLAKRINIRIAPSSSAKEAR